MSIESSIEVIRKVWINDGYLLVRPWPEDTGCVELCTEPAPESDGWLGKINITFGTPEALRCLAKALTDAAADMEAQP